MLSLKAKSKFQYIFEYYKYFVNTQSFLFVLLLLILFSIYGVSLQFGVFLTVGEIEFFSGLKNILTFPWFLLGILLTVLIHTYYNFRLFEKQNAYIIRCGSYRQYLKRLIFYILFGNAFLLMINLLLIMTGMNLFAIHDFSKILVFLVSFTKFFFMVEVISVLNILLFKLLPRILVFLINIIFCVILIAIPQESRIISSILELPFFIGSYLLNLQYSTIYFEILSYSLCMGILLIIIYFLFQFVIKHMKDVEI